MSAAERLAALAEQGRGLYAVLDAARWPGLSAWLRAGAAPSQCIFSGAQATVYAAVAPYLLHVQGPGPALDELVHRRWDTASAVFLRSQASFAEVRRALRLLTYVQDEQGETMYFRYYDPRVLRVILPTCDEAQLDQLYGRGVIDAFFTEGEEPDELFRFAPERGEDGVLRVVPRLLGEPKPPPEPILPSMSSMSALMARGPRMSAMSATSATREGGVAR